jgi:monofunctional biosynthetic peptidoglycan transglycosylase
LLVPVALALLSVTVVLLLRWVPPPTSAFALQWRLEHGRAASRRWVPLRQISPEMALAAIAAEDQKFLDHHGFDFGAIGEAVEERFASGRVRGASTISQQVAKNLFLWPGRSWLRKGLETWFTVWIELLWPKRRILETYLNVAELGNGVFGVEAAARRYFRVPAARLHRGQAALLAATLPNPELLSAAHPSRYVLERRTWILSQMNRLGGRAYLERL